MLRPIDEKPVHPKNGDKYKTKDGIFEFRYGRFLSVEEKDDILELEKKQLY